MTSSTLSVTRRIGLSREKPQYRQLLMHSLERYSGANRRIVRPKFRRVIEREAWAIASSCRSDFCAIRCLNWSTSSDFFSARLSSVSTNDMTIISCAQQRSQTPIALANLRLSVGAFRAFENLGRVRTKKSGVRNVGRRFEKYDSRFPRTRN